MPRQLITSEDLSTFFRPTRRDVQDLLPLLVCRLILATCKPNSISKLVMPGGDDVRVPGWDGTLQLGEPHPFVPLGCSAWEMGISGDPATKADKDLEKRTKDPRGIEPQAATFVFVTPHVWTGRSTWEQSANTGATWASVAAIDGTILTSWLEQAPTVAAWLLRERGTPILDLDDLRTGWFRTIEEPYGVHATPAVILGGRADQQAEVLTWLEQPSADLEIACESPEEAVAFVLATVRQAEPDVRSSLEARLLVARSRDAVEYLGLLRSPHVVAVADPSIETDLKAARLPNVHFVLPRPGSLGRRGGDASSIVLPTLQCEAVELALRESKLPTDLADLVARESRGSLQGVLWGLGTRIVHQLEWAREPAASALAPLVLVRQ